MSFERLVLTWLHRYLVKYMERDQFRGMAGHSIAHYLVEISTAIMYNFDLKTPHGSIGLIIDYSKGFNMICHNRVITLLADMNVPGWLLRIIGGYLTNRKLRVRFKGIVTEPQPLPGGAGQGTLLGMWLFLIVANSAGGHPEMQLGQKLYQPLRHGAKSLTARQPILKNNLQGCFNYIFNDKFLVFCDHAVPKWGQYFKEWYNVYLESSHHLSSRCFHSG